MSNPNQQQHQNQKTPPQQPPPAAVIEKWKPDDNTFILVPDDSGHQQAVKAALRARFGAGYKGVEVTLLDVKWLHKDSTVLVVPLRDKDPGEDPTEFISRVNERDRAPGAFAGFLECDPVSIAAHDAEARPSDRIWRAGKHALDGSIRLKGDGGLVDLLNQSLINGYRALPDGTRVPGVPLGRVTPRIDVDRKTRQITAQTLQLSNT